MQEGDAHVGGLRGWVRGAVAKRVGGEGCEE